jgi:hypothetical protein
MGHLPDRVLNELRSPARALADLVEKFNKTARNHPDLPKMARMIRLLSEEIALRGGPCAGITGADAEFGLC